MYLKVFKKPKNSQYCSVKALPSYPNLKIGNAKAIRHHIQIAKVCTPWKLTEFDKVQYNIQLCRKSHLKIYCHWLWWWWVLAKKKTFLLLASLITYQEWSMFFNLYKHLKMMWFGNFAKAIKNILIHKLIPALSFIVTYFFCRGKKTKLLPSSIKS